MEETLKFLVDKGLSTRAIAKEIGWSQNKVVRKLKALDLKTIFVTKNDTNRYCSHCQKLLRKRTQQKFCSISCQTKFRWKQKVSNLESNRENTTPETLKKYFKTELKIVDCQECGQKPVWNGKPLVMQLDHIDGNSDNNKLFNLRLICPNCHTQTPTFSSKGKGSRYKKKTKRNRYLREYKRD